MALSFEGGSSSAGKPLGRANLEEPLAGDVRPQALRAGEARLERVEAAGSLVGEGADRVAPERGRAVVDVVEGRVLRALLVAEDEMRRCVATFERPTVPSFWKTPMTPSQSLAASSARSGAA